MYEYAARLVKVVDGDTVDLDVDLGFDIHTRQRIRLLGTIVASNRILNSDLVTEGHAVDYDGGRRALPAQPGERDPHLPVR